MKRYLFFISLVACLFSCKKQDEDKRPEDNLPGFSVEISVVSGVRNNTDVISMPKMELTVTGGDELAEYAMAFKVDDGKEVEIDGVWSSLPRSIDSFLMKSTEWGWHSVRGRAYRKDGEGGVATFEGGYWMRGLPLNNVSQEFVCSGEKRSALSGPITVYVSEQFEWRLNYSPAETPVTPTIEVEQDGHSVSIYRDQLTVSPGWIIVRGEIIAEGRAKISAKLQNGELTTTAVTDLNCVADPKHDYRFDFSVSGADEVVLGAKQTLTLTLESGADDALYDIQCITEDRVVTRSGVSLKGGYSILTDRMTRTGSHTSEVTVSRHDGAGRSVLKDFVFDVIGEFVSGIEVSALLPGAQSTSEVETYLPVIVGEGVILTISPVNQGATAANYVISSKGGAGLTVSQQTTVSANSVSAVISTSEPGPFEITVRETYSGISKTFKVFSCLLVEVDIVNDDNALSLSFDGTGIFDTGNNNYRIVQLDIEGSVDYWGKFTSIWNLTTNTDVFNKTFKTLNYNCKGGSNTIALLDVSAEMEELKKQKSSTLFSFTPMFGNGKIMITPDSPESATPMNLVPNDFVYFKTSSSIFEIVRNPDMNNYLANR